jgi:serine phosphatase RsbU (regulator of sigma subunit)
MAKARKVRRPRSSRAWLISMLWQQPLYAIPFALFFGTLFGAGGGWESYWSAYKVSLVFSYVIGLSVWATETFVISRLRPDEGPRRIPLWAEILTFVGVSVLASMVGAVIVHFTFAPGMLENIRSFFITAMFSVLFGLLVTALIYGVIFYRQALQRARADQELNMARRIQRSFLISNFPRRPRLEVHAVNWSSREVSGDFYDVVPAGDEGLLIAIADVSGKGVPAALLSSMLQASLRTQAGAERSVAAMMGRINTLVCKRADTGQFATFFLASIDERDLTLRYTNAGHNFPVLLSRNGRRLLDKGGTVVGMAEQLSWAEEEIALLPGDRLILYTDGVSEAADASGDMYGEDRLYALLESIGPDLTAPAMVDRVLDALREFLGEVEPADDVTVLAVRVLDPARRVLATPPARDAASAATRG